MQELEAKPMENCWLMDCFLWFVQLPSLYRQAHLPRTGTAQSGLCPPTSSRNKKKCHTAIPIGQSDLVTSSMEAPSSQVCQVDTWRWLWHLCLLWSSAPMSCQPVSEPGESWVMAAPSPSTSCLLFSEHQLQAWPLQLSFLHLVRSTNLSAPVPYFLYITSPVGDLALQSQCKDTGRHWLSLPGGAPLLTSLLQCWG